MAKKEIKYGYPSRFGSHTSMINHEETQKLFNSGITDMVVCTDEYGDYVTFSKRLDTGGIDTKRSDGRRIKYEKEKSK